MERWFPLACLLLLAPGAAQAGSAVLATIGGEPVTTEQLADEMRHRGSSTSFADKALLLTPAGKEQIFKDLLRQRLFLRAAGDAGVTLPPEAQAELERLRRNLLVRHYLAGEARGEAPTEQELRAHFDAHPERFTVPEQRRVRHLVVKTREEAEELAADLAAGADFASLAREHSIDAAREKGGDLGWVRPRVMVKEFDEAAFSLPPGRVSGIVQTRFGYHLLRIEEVRPAERKRFEDVEEDVRRAVEEEQVAELGRKLESKYGLTVDREALESFIKGKEGLP